MGGVGRRVQGGGRLLHHADALFGLAGLGMNGVRMLDVKIVAAVAAVAHKLLWPQGYGGAGGEGLLVLGMLVQAWCSPVATLWEQVKAGQELSARTANADGIRPFVPTTCVDPCCGSGARDDSLGSAWLARRRRSNDGRRGCCWGPGTAARGTAAREQARRERLGRYVEYRGYVHVDWRPQEGWTHRAAG